MKQKNKHIAAVLLLLMALFIAGLMSVSASSMDETAQEVSMAEVDFEKYSAAKINIGEKQYIYNLQLKQQISLATISTEPIIEYVEEKGEDATRLKEIQSELIEIESSIDEQELTREEFLEKLSEVKKLTGEFKTEVHAKVSVEDIPEIQKEIEANNLLQKERIGQIKQIEIKARNYYNTKQINEAIENLKTRVADIKTNGVNSTTAKDAAAQIESLNNYKNEFLNKESTKETIASFKQKWNSVANNLGNQNKDNGGGK